MSLVSVIIPTYKRADKILRAVQSAFAQSHNMLEVIVVDDNGLGTPEQIDTHLRLDPFISDRSIRYVAHQENRGANAARNTGIDNSNGDYITFLDDDDEWMTDKLEKQVSMAQNDHSIGVVYTQLSIKYDDLNLEYTTRPRARGYIHDLLLIENCVGAFTSALVRRQALIEYRLDETLPARQDYDLWLRVSKHWRFEVIDEVLAISHAAHSSSRISSNIENYVKAMSVLEAKYAEEIKKLTEEAARRRKAEQCFFLGSQAIKARRPDLARKYFAKSIRIEASMKATLAFIASMLGTRVTIYVRAAQSALSK